MLIQFVRSRLAIGVLVTAAFLSACRAATQEAPPPDALALAELWDAERTDLPAPPLVTHARLEVELDRLERLGQGALRRTVAGRSVEGRALHHLTLGTGDTPILLWSQMHGDEPTATSALLDLCQWLLRHRDDPVPARILSRLTLHMLPMLNPDGAERFTRRNAQGIDINRDALLLQTPEGRALKAVRDRHEPRIGFNLHNQNWRTSVGRPARPAALSLLAVAYDEQRSENDVRRLARRTASVIVDAVAPLVDGHVGRYDDEFEERAFGDNITRWGTGVVLVETGPWPGADPDAMLVRLNFVALVSALDALASGRVHDADPARYDALPENEARLLHTVVRNATVTPGTGVAPFTGDVGLAGQRVVRVVGGQRAVRWQATIADIGDLRGFGALEDIDASGLTVAPAYDAGAREGTLVDLPVSRQGGPGPTIAIGQPASVWLLEPVDGGRYRLVRHVLVD
jgi:hypothetical protein